MHEKFWHSPQHDLENLLKALDVFDQDIKAIIKQIMQNCTECRKHARCAHKLVIKATLAIRFNDRVQMDLLSVGTKPSIS